MDATTRRPRTWNVAFVLALAGAALAIVLIREYLTVLEGAVAGGLFCGGAGRFDCNLVAAHPAATLLGAPTALWGLVYYVAAAALALCAGRLADGERAAAAAFGSTLALVALGVDAALAFVMVTRIGAICLNCVATYAVNLALAAAFWRLSLAATAPRAWRTLFLEWRGGNTAKLVAFGAALSVALVSIVVTMRTVGGDLEFARDQATEFLRSMSAPPAIDMRALDDRPSRGPRDARVVIAVASDFQCGFCRALSAHLDDLRREYPRDVRVIFLNAPIDPACNPSVPPDEHGHPDACWLARAGACAADHGRFWEYHDLVYRTLPQPQVNPLTVLAHATEIGLPVKALAACADSAAAERDVARDVALWRRLRMKAVPSLIIDGHVRPGGIYPATLRAIVHGLLAAR